MKTSMSSTESTTDSTPKMPSPSGYGEQKQETPPAEDNSIQEMYGEPEKKEVPPPPAEEKKETPPVEEKKIVTGYKKEIEEEKETPPESKEPVTDEEKAKKEIEEIVKGLPESVSKDKVTEFALKNKLTNEQLKAYAEFAKEEHEKSETANQEFIKNQRKEWNKELLTDPEFGGENFDKNVDRVEKVIENHFPNMKKVLTERGSVLPPYIMKDFLALSKILNPVAPLVNGDPGETKETGKNFLDDLYQ